MKRALSPPRITPFRKVCLFLGMLSGAVAGHAESDVSTSQEAASPSQTPPLQEEIRVRGAKGEGGGGPAEVSIPLGTLREVPHRSAEGLLRLVPGLVLSNHGGEGHATGMFLRGFDSGEGKDIEIRVDGIPINEPSNPHEHGYADTHFVIPELVRALQVSEGPFQAQQGDFALAGTIDYRLGLESRGGRVRAAYGSFGTKRLVGVWGPEGASTNTFVGMDVEQSQGFGPRRNRIGGRWMSQYEHTLDSGITLAVLATGYLGQFESAGLLREDDVAAQRIPNCPADPTQQFFCFYDPHQGGISTRHGVVGRLTQSRRGFWMEHQLFGTLRHLQLQENRTGMQLNPEKELDPDYGDGLAQGYDSVTLGSRSRYTWTFRQEKRVHALHVGADTRYDAATSLEQRLRPTTGIPWKTEDQIAMRLAHLAPYAAGRVQLLPWLTLRVGLRLATFVFALKALPSSSVQTATDMPLRAGGIWLPKTSVDVAFSPTLHWITSYGRGARSQSAQTLRDAPVTEPVADDVHALETGGRYTVLLPHRTWLTTRAVGFLTYVSRELQWDAQSGGLQDAGPSRRYGMLGTARLSSPWGLDAQGSVTYTHAQRLPSSPDLSPSPVSGIPRWLARLDASFHREIHLSTETLHYTVAAGAQYLASRSLEYGHETPGFGTLDLSTRLRWQRVELGIEITNLFDARTRPFAQAYQSYFGSPDAAPSPLTQVHFAAGPPRMLLGTLTLFLDTPSAQ